MIERGGFWNPHRIYAPFIHLYPQPLALLADFANWKFAQSASIYKKKNWHIELKGN